MQHVYNCINQQICEEETVNGSKSDAAASDTADQSRIYKPATALP